MNRIVPLALSAISTAGLCLSAAAAPAAPAKPAAIAGFSFVKSLAGIDEYRLDANDLTVLLVPDHSAPVVTFMVTYRVGSRNEVSGTTGATHLLEHLMFKGSKNYNNEKGNSVEQYLERVGGNYNANTSLDRTAYYAQIGSESLEGYIAIDADRMRNLMLRESDRSTEMTVVRNEFEIGENDPVQSLDKEIFAASYIAHPYHHPVIGWRSDIENVSIEKLRAFYDTYYWPNNATVTVVGDFQTENALALIRKYYGEIPRAPAAIPVPYTAEPAQTGPRFTFKPSDPALVRSKPVVIAVNGRDPRGRAFSREWSVTRASKRAAIVAEPTSPGRCSYRCTTRPITLTQC